MRPAILFDLGNTLASYYRADEFEPILRQSVTALFGELSRRNLATVSLETALSSAQKENRESPDCRFGPMAERFERIFQISLVDDPSFARRLCETFLAPIFAVGRVYDDTRWALEILRRDGYPLGIVSNAPWGSPPDLWRNELARLGLFDLVDVVVFCGDTGWRKPAPAIFEHAATALSRSPDHCMFVGDDLDWDISGSRAVGMRPILLDRDRRHASYSGQRIADLNGLIEVLEA